MLDVIEHPAFIADPFAALSAHLETTVDQQNSRALEKKIERVQKNGGDAAVRSAHKRAPGPSHSRGIHKSSIAGRKAGMKQHKRSGWTNVNSKRKPVRR